MVAPGTAAAADHARRVAGYAEARARRDELLEQWAGALARVAAYVESNAVGLAQTTTSLLVTGYSAELKRRTAKVLTAEAAHQRAAAERAQRSVRELFEQLRDGRLKPAAHHLDTYQDLQDRAWRATAAADDADEALRTLRLPRPLGVGLGLLGPGLTLYGVHDDMQHGESFEQAAVSQGGGLMAGMVSGGVVGASIGSAAPVAGTLAGGVAGVVGGAVASGLIDRRYEQQAAEEEAAAEAAVHDREQQLIQLMNVREGLPLYATPGSDAPLYGEGSR